MRASRIANEHSVRYLCHHGNPHARNGATPVHEHSFWQMEYIQRGSAKFELEDGVSRLASGAIALIPPHRAHSFSFDARGASFFSLKFQMDDDTVAPGRIENHAGVSGIVMALVALLPLGRSPDAQRRLLCEDLIWNIVRCVYSPGPPANNLETQIADACAALVPQRPAASAVARALGLSRRGLHDRCQRAFGCSGREAIDRWLLSQAQTLLLYGGRGLSDIATSLGFADEFSFARFFKRQSGVAPGRWRARAAPPTS